YAVLLQFVPYYLIHRGTEIEVDSTSVKTRFPDLTVLTQDGFNAIPRGTRSLITKAMPNPILVVEIVSPGKPSDPNYQRDYVEKPTEYAARGIFEYWRIDPSRNVVMVLTLEGGQYQETVFRGSDRLTSPSFPALELTAEQILNTGQ
ncbi:MAG: Uma2 family endonuclease, partial [Leptolyngbyaceae cyanobacterium SL_7_1]|nr:Uma2 family endonuclease [Leptolyngbyaceae cyanobacterium SL_7_1]